MAGTIADSSPAALIEQLGDVWDTLLSLGAGLSDDEWSRPTSCPGWPVAAHYAHVVGTESMLLGRPEPDAEAGRPDHVRNDIGAFNERWVVALAGEPREAVLERLAEVATARKQALSAMGEGDFVAPSWTPVGEAPYSRFMQIRVFDCWVHEQDVRDAAGRPPREVGPAAEQSFDEMVRALGYLVGKKAAAPDGSSVTIDLTGPVRRRLHVAVAGGRGRVVDALDGPATATLTLSSTAFARVGCGRVEPSAVLGGALGGVSLAGDTDLGRRVVTSLPFTI